MSSLLSELVTDVDNWGSCWEHTKEFCGMHRNIYLRQKMGIFVDWLHSPVCKCCSRNVNCLTLLDLCLYQNN